MRAVQRRMEAFGILDRVGGSGTVASGGRRKKASRAWRAREGAAGARIVNERSLHCRSLRTVLPPSKKTCSSTFKNCV